MSNHQMYGDSKPCEKCERPVSEALVECDVCGAHACVDCAAMRSGGVEWATGYKDEAVICLGCLDRVEVLDPAPVAIASDAEVAF